MHILKSIEKSSLIVYNGIKEVKQMKKNLVSDLVKLVNFSLKVDANSTSTVAAHQPKVPKKLSEFKNDK